VDINQLLQALNKLSLHDYIVLFAQYKSKGNATECNRIINKMTTAEQIKEQEIASTNGAILHPSDSVSPMGATYGWMSYVIWYTPPTYDSVNGYIVGDIQYPNNLAGQSDGNYALLWTDGWNENYNNPEGGEAFAEGAAWNGQSGWLTGSVWVHAYTSQPSWDNYVIASYYDGSQWHYFAPAYGQVWQTSPSDVYIGTTSAQFTQIAVECWTPPPYPQYYSPLIQNYVWIDSVKIG
jgi:hypothetical protein